MEITNSKGFKKKPSFLLSKITQKSKSIDYTKNNMDNTWIPGADPPSNDAGVPRAIFIPHPNSLPFEERRVTLEQPVKIGRNVYRATPTPTNTIFECRVLSRHHATLYYEKGHFYLVDNQSSNGTFINDNRCSISKEQEPYEVYSGDVVQFGISVVENAGNVEKNTFPPVVALLKLYHADGGEAKLSFNPTMTTPLHLRELYQLNNFVQEAIQRETSLETRLRTLRECVERARAEARGAWELFVGEQRLMMRVRSLEAALAAGRAPQPDHVAQLLDDKKNYQRVATESLRAAHEQRLALEEALERRSRENAALHQHNGTLRLAANNAAAELQKLAARCERKMCAARLAIAAAEEREAAARAQLPLTYSVQNGEAKMLVLSADGAREAREAREGRRDALEDAVWALPDFIKLMLPQTLLSKAGLKSVSTEGKTAKEFELILQKNNVYDTESRISEKGSAEAADEGGSEEKGADLGTDDEKQSRLNHDTEGSTSPPDGELHDNNANSTYADDDERADSPSTGAADIGKLLLVVSGLNAEVQALRARAAAAAAEAAALRSVRDELLAARPQEPDDAAACRARLADLQAQISRTTVAEEANLAEIQRLASSAAELQAELAFRPTRDDVEQLSAAVLQLHRELAERGDELERLRRPPARDAAAGPDEPAPAPPPAPPAPPELDKISADIDELFQLDYEDDESDSAATEVMTSPGERDAGERLALQQELVRAKEQWAAAAAERARLAEQLAALRAPSLAKLHYVTLLLPLFAAALYWLFLPHIS